MCGPIEEWVPGGENFSSCLRSRRSRRTARLLSEAGTLCDFAIYITIEAIG